MDVQKDPSIYMRFHVTLQKAISFCKHLYKDSLVPNTNLPQFHLAIITAGLTEDIVEQDYLDYHLTWLTGVLCDSMQFNKQEYEMQIEDVLSKLHDVESKRIQEYIRLLTYNRELSRGQQYKNMLDRVGEMDVIPCYIMIFRLYQKCESMQERRAMLSKDQYEGFTAYAFLFWYRAISRHMRIGKNIRPYIKDFFRKIEQEIGGMSDARKKADRFFKAA